MDEFTGRRFDYVVSVCDNARDHCPVFPSGTGMVHWSFEDPAAIEGDEATRPGAFRRIRNQIREKVGAFLGQR